MRPFNQFIKCTSIKYRYGKARTVNDQCKSPLEEIITFDKAGNQTTIEAYKIVIKLDD